MTDNNNKLKLMHPFELHAAQAVVDIKSMEEGSFTPDIYFTDGPQGLWAANKLRRYIIKMGYQAEIALDPVTTRHGACQHLKVGRIPESFLYDIKHFMSVEEIHQKKAHYCVQMDDNGKFKTTAETAMWHAFEASKKNQKPRSTPN